MRESQHHCTYTLDINSALHRITTLSFIVDVENRPNSRAVRMKDLVVWRAFAHTIDLGLAIHNGSKLLLGCDLRMSVMRRLPAPDGLIVRGSSRSGNDWKPSLMSGSIMLRIASSSQSGLWRRREPLMWRHDHSLDVGYFFRSLQKKKRMRLIASRNISLSVVVDTCRQPETRWGDEVAPKRHPSRAIQMVEQGEVQKKATMTTP